ncbi:hypothetical protein F383_37726 [Gossypium arboreum]|uniref:Uncharacterized protein n=1 Tax=Gossypium arboreum TaxID=29729 RepID=A0A0B0MHK8_GOSAR|nr:hypothetical protein F383_37726 [Gossypium arboreum]
MKLQVYQNNHY